MQASHQVDDLRALAVVKTSSILHTRQRSTLFDSCPCRAFDTPSDSGLLLFHSAWRCPLLAEIHALSGERCQSMWGRVGGKSALLILTARERDVVRGIASGRTNREIAKELGISVQTVKNILSVVYQKCHVRNRLELAVSALQYKLFSR